MQPPIDWLLDGEAYIAYRTRRDLLGQSEDDPQVRAARLAMLAYPPLRDLTAELAGWPGVVIASHKSAGQPYHKLTFLADLGLRADDPGMGALIARVMQHRSEEGAFQIPAVLPAQGGAPAREAWAWALCDTPLIVYALAKFGLAGHPAVRAAAEHLHGLGRANGWPCAVSKELGNWRGPGRKEDPCPFANLAVLKALAAFDDYRASPAALTGAETLLRLWSESLTQHPYMFYMGSDFRKLKAPLVWYDLLHVLDALTRFAPLRADPRLREMLAVLQSKADSEGRFTVESVWTAWKDWEFGQKKTPSRWLTLLAWRVIGRVEGVGVH